MAVRVAVNQMEDLANVQVVNLVDSQAIVARAVFLAVDSTDKKSPSHGGVIFYFLKIVLVPIDIGTAL